VLQARNTPQRPDIDEHNVTHPIGNRLVVELPVDPTDLYMLGRSTAPRRQERRRQPADRQYFCCSRHRFGAYEKANKFISA
jgi:hypothetical protein